MSHTYHIHSPFDVSHSAHALCLCASQKYTASPQVRIAVHAQQLRACKPAARRSTHPLRASPVSLRHKIRVILALSRASDRAQEKFNKNSKYTPMTLNADFGKRPGHNLFLESKFLSMVEQSCTLVDTVGPCQLY